MKFLIVDESHGSHPYHITLVITRRLDNRMNFVFTFKKSTTERVFRKFFFQLENVPPVFRQVWLVVEGSSSKKKVLCRKL